MTAPELLARLTDELPEVASVIPVAFLEDESLPTALTLVEPVGFTCACTSAAWGLLGLEN